MRVSWGCSRGAPRFGTLPFFGFPSSSLGGFGNVWWWGSAVSSVWQWRQHCPGQFADIMQLEVLPPVFVLTAPGLRTFHHFNVEPIKPRGPWFVDRHELTCRAWGVSFAKMRPATLAEVVDVGNNAHSVQHRSRHLGDAD